MNERKDEKITFTWDGKKYEAKNTAEEQKLKPKGDDSGKEIKIKDLQKGFFQSKASIDGGEVKRITFHWPFWISLASLLLAFFGGLGWILASRKKKEDDQEEDAL